jgi:hypothetical protein
MRGTVAKRLRRQAERETVGASPDVTRRRYKQLKRQYKAGR